VFTIRSGIVRFERATEAGDRRIVRLAGRGDLIGQEALLRRPYNDDAVACTPVQVCRIPRSLIDNLGETETPLLRELMQRWQSALTDAEAWVADLAMGPSRRRLLRLLVKLAEHAGESGSVWLPRRDEIGAMLDMTLETASRLISQCRREGVLELKGLREVKLDKDRLLEAVRLQDAV
jgi:CRP-like cAMP-binding protein